MCYCCSCHQKPEMIVRVQGASRIRNPAMSELFGFLFCCLFVWYPTLHVCRWNSCRVLIGWSELGAALLNGIIQVCKPTDIPCMAPSIHVATSFTGHSNHISGKTLGRGECVCVALGHALSVSCVTSDSTGHSHAYLGIKG